MDKKRTFFGQVSSRLTGINDKRKEIFFLWCLLVGLILISSKIFGENRELKAKLEGLEAENQLLEKQNKEQEKTNFLIKEENSFFSERLKIVYTTEYIEEKMEERLQKRYGSELKIVGCYPMGEDTKENRRRFYICTSEKYKKYYLNFYFIDYLTGEVVWMSERTPSMDFIRNIERKEEEIQVLFEDFDGNGMLDILVVLSFEDQGEEEKNGRILLWMQREDQFVAFNDIYCGEKGHEKELEEMFSIPIKGLEEQFYKEQKSEDWEIEQVALWVKKELFAGKEEELSWLLYPPERRIFYGERREAEEIHVSVTADENGLYQVSIPEVLYSEKKINDWFLKFYQEEVKRKEEFMGVGIKESDTYLTMEERIQANFFYDTLLSVERVDDAVISIFGNTTTYSGGAHENDDSFSVNFETKSGSVLTLEEMFLDVNAFRNKVMDYMEQNYEDCTEWWLGYVREAVWEEQWYLTEAGIVFFLNNINGLGIRFYEIPYEYFADDIKVEYLPVFQEEPVLGNAYFYLKE